jgi:hypothetical protein
VRVPLSICRGVAGRDAGSPRRTAVRLAGAPESGHVGNKCPSLKSPYLGWFFSTSERTTDSESPDHASERRCRAVIAAPRIVSKKIACWHVARMP